MFRGGDCPAVCPVKTGPKQRQKVNALWLRTEEIEREAIERD